MTYKEWIARVEEKHKIQQQFLNKPIYLYSRYHINTTRKNGRGRSIGWGLTTDCMRKRAHHRERPTGTLEASSWKAVDKTVKAYIGNSEVRRSYKWHVRQVDGVWQIYVY